LGDLDRVRLRERPAEHGEVLGEGEHGAAVHRSPSGDDAVAWDLRLVHAELARAMLDKHVELFERALVEQEFKPLARSKLAAFVLRLDAVFPAAQARLRAARLEFFENVLHCASNPASGTPWKFLSCCRAGANAPGLHLDSRASCFGV